MSAVDARSRPAQVTAEQPWPGLFAYTEDDTEYFIGRSDETAELLRLINCELLTTLYGKSGLGKSSLLQAGLFPLLRKQEFLPVYIKLVHDEAASPLAEQVLARLQEECAKHAVEPPASLSGGTLWEYFHRVEAVFWNTRNRIVTPVLVFDQFEELFTLGHSNLARRERGRAFLAELADLIQMRPPRALVEQVGKASRTRFDYDRPGCKIVLSVREDFLPELEDLRPLIPSLIHNRMRIEAFTKAQALDVLQKQPGAELVKNDVAQAIVQFVSQSARGGSDWSESSNAHTNIEPWFLSLFCRELNTIRIDQGLTQFTTDLLTRYKDTIVSKFYERSVADSKAVRQFIEDALIIGSGYRNSVPLVALPPDVTLEDIARLVDRRLLRQEEYAGLERVILTHDVLIEPIKRSRDERRKEEELVRLRSRNREQSLKMSLLALFVAILVLATIISVVEYFRAEAALAEQKRLRFEVAWTSAVALEKGGDYEKVVEILKPHLGFQELNQGPHFQEAKKLFEECKERIDFSSNERKKFLAHGQNVAIYFGNGATLELVLIPAGQFNMGSPENETGRGEDEHLHNVTISKPFYMAKYSITHSLFDQIMGVQLDSLESPSHPVRLVNWTQSNEFCKKLQEKLKEKWELKKLDIQLPTEAQWEYACRAGTKTRFYTGDSIEELKIAAWCVENSNESLHPFPVGTKKANEFGLYDMHGNVLQWCRDAYTIHYERLPTIDPFVSKDDEKSIAEGNVEQGEEPKPKIVENAPCVVRGGSFLKGPAESCRSACRSFLDPTTRFKDVGFRIVVSVPQ